MELSAVSQRLLPFLRPRVAWVLPMIYLVLGGALIGLAGTAPVERATTDQLPGGYDSTEVARLVDAFPSGRDQVAVVLFSADRALSPGDREAVAAVLERVSGGTQLQPSADGTALVGVVPVAETDATRLADDVDELRAQVREGLPDGVRAAVTGPAAIQGDDLDKAYSYINHMLTPDAQIAWSKATQVAPANSATTLPAEVQKTLIETPATAKGLWNIDYAWFGENKDTWTEQWQKIFAG